MSSSCPRRPSGSWGSRGGGISTTMKDSGLRRHSTHSINEGEGRVLRSSAVGERAPSTSYKLQSWGAAKAKWLTHSPWA